MKSAGKGLRISCLPNPHQVNLLRRHMNTKLEDLIGSFYNINDALVLPANNRSKNKDPVKVTLNHMNSFFVDVEMVQQTMVQLYGITLEGMYRHLSLSLLFLVLSSPFSSRLLLLYYICIYISFICVCTVSLNACKL